MFMDPIKEKIFVIPKFVDLIKNNKSLTIYGSGKQQEVIAMQGTQLLQLYQSF